MCQARAWDFRIPIAISRFDNLAIPPGQSHIRPRLVGTPRGEPGRVSAVSVVDRVGWWAAVSSRRGLRGWRRSRGGGCLVAPGDLVVGLGKPAVSLHDRLAHRASPALIHERPEALANRLRARVDDTASHEVIDLGNEFVVESDSDLDHAFSIATWYTFCIIAADRDDTWSDPPGGSALPSLRLPQQTTCPYPGGGTRAGEHAECVPARGRGFLPAP